MEVKCGWVNFSTNDLCKSVPERNVSIPFHLDSTTKTTDKCLMWVLSATLYAKAVWEEWSHRRIRLDLALLCCMWQIARTATSARQAARLLDNSDHWQSACEQRQLSQTLLSCYSDLTVPTRCIMKASVLCCKPLPLCSRRPRNHNPIISLLLCCLNSASM